MDYKHPFLTILFPIDRYGELGVRSRNLHSAQGFSRRRVLQSIYEFYQVTRLRCYGATVLRWVEEDSRGWCTVPLQENMSDEEVQVAIHTDSRHADHLRLGLVSRRNGDGQLARCKFLGSRKSYDSLKRVGRGNCGQIYELLLGA